MSPLPFGEGLTQLLTYGAQDHYLVGPRGATGSSGINPLHIYIDKNAETMPQLRLDALYLYLESNLYITEVDLHMLQCLTYFSCYSNNLLKIIHSLPQSLEKIWCAHNRLLTSLPALPNKISDIILSDMPMLTSIPALPTELKSLQCTQLPITAFPALPNKLTSIYLQHLLLTSIPELPAELRYLTCENMLITELPALPSQLQCLSLRNNNQLRGLPVLPETLDNLYVTCGALQMLPDLPKTLTRLNCHDNNLTELPVLPESLTHLECYGNNLTELPNLPETLIVLCWPNSVDAVYPELRTLYDTKDKAVYVNEVNSRRRTHQRTALLKSDIMEAYARKTMNPINLLPLLADPDKDVDGFMSAYVDGL